MKIQQHKLRVKYTIFGIIVNDVRCTALLLQHRLSQGSQVIRLGTGGLDELL